MPLKVAPNLRVVEIVRPGSAYKQVSWLQLTQRVRQYFREQQLELRFAEAVNEIANQDFDIIHINSIHTLPIMHAHLRKIPILTTLHVPPIRDMKKGLFAFFCIGVLIFMARMCLMMTWRKMKDARDLH
jgi:hypothetical protein